MPTALATFLNKHHEKRFISSNHLFNFDLLMTIYGQQHAIIGTTHRSFVDYSIIAINNSKSANDSKSKSFDFCFEIHQTDEIIYEHRKLIRRLVTRA